MSQTTHDGATGDPGPSVNREQIHDLDRMRRTSEDRYVAGVAGGLGRHFGIDPTVVRVVLAALCLFGGAGILLYGALWLFVPEEGSDRAPIQVSGETRRVLLISAVVLSAVLLFGGGFGFHTWHFAWPLALLALVVVAFAGNRRRTERAQAPQSPVAPSGEAMGPMPPTTQYAVPPRRPRSRRTGPVLFWPTLALVAVGLGALGIYGTAHAVAPAAYPALALAIVGAMLVLGSFAGRAGGLILLGLLTLPPLAAASALGAHPWKSHHEIVAPTSVSQLHTSYAADNGDLTIDLTGLGPADLAGRTVHASLDAGQIKIIVPRGITTEVQARIRYAGDIEVGNDNEGGFNPQITDTIGGSATQGGVLHLVANAHVGHIQIEEY